MAKISAGDTAWMLTSTALVLMMCVPGLALFYGGMAWPPRSFTASWSVSPF